ARSVDRLVRLGYVVRSIDELDRRRVILCLTPRGLAVYRQVERLYRRLDEEWRKVLSKDENALLDSLMNRLEDRARELFGSPAYTAVATPVHSARDGETGSGVSAMPES